MCWAMYWSHSEAWSETSETGGLKDQTDLKVILNGVLLRGIIDSTKHFELIFFCFVYYFVLVDDQYSPYAFIFACKNFFSFICM